MKGTYKICQKCYGKIVRNGIMVYRKQGLGFKKEGKAFHKFCWREVKSKFNKPVRYPTFLRVREMLGYKV